MSPPKSAPGSPPSKNPSPKEERRSPLLTRYSRYQPGRALSFLFADQGLRILPPGNGAADEEECHDSRPKNVVSQEPQQGGDADTADYPNCARDLQATDFAETEPQKRT